MDHINEVYDNLNCKSTNLLRLLKISPPIKNVNCPQCGDTVSERYIWEATTGNLNQLQSNNQIFDRAISCKCGHHELIGRIIK